MKATARKIVYFLERGEEPWRVEWNQSRARPGEWSAVVYQNKNEWLYLTGGHSKPSEAASARLVELGAKTRRKARA